MTFKRWIVSLLGDEVDLLMWDRLAWLHNHPEDCSLSKSGGLCWSVDSPTLYFIPAGGETEVRLYASPWGDHLEGSFCFTSKVASMMANRVVTSIVKKMKMCKNAKLRECFVEALIDGDFVQPDIP